MYILEGIAKAIGLVVLISILMFFAKKPTKENKFEAKKYIKWIILIEIILIFYVILIRLYFGYSFLSYTFVIGIIISTTTEKWLGYGFLKNMEIIVKEKLHYTTLNIIFTVSFLEKKEVITFFLDLLR